MSETKPFPLPDLSKQLSRQAWIDITSRSHAWKPLAGDTNFITVKTFIASCTESSLIQYKLTVDAGRSLSWAPLPKRSAPYERVLITTWEEAQDLFEALFPNELSHWRVETRGKILPLVFLLRKSSFPTLTYVIAGIYDLSLIDAVLSKSNIFHLENFLV